MTTSKLFLHLLAISALLVGAALGETRAEQLSGNGLVAALRQGGYVLLMRHTHSPEERPDKAAADPENTNLERQLDQAGRDTARAMGEAIKKLGIPIGDVLSSPTYRALETVRLASLGQAQAFPQLGDGGQSMQRVQEAPADWLRKRVGEAPRAGTDTIMVTHLPNITAAYGRTANAVADGEALVFQPDGKGAAELIGRVKIEEWPALASRQ
jgi:phosphohistidine phosphatase SixA